MEMKKQERNLGCRVILFPQAYTGHLTPMLHLGNALYSKGFSITIIQTRFNSPDPTGFPQFTFHHIEDSLSKTEPAPTDPGEILRSLHASCLNLFRESLSFLLEDASNGNEPIACLIADPMWEFAGNVTDEFNLPRLALTTSGLFSFLLCKSIPFLHEKGYFPLQDARLEEPVPEFPPLRVKDLPSETLHDIAVGMVKQSRSYSEGIICNTFKELESFTLDKARENLHNFPTLFPTGPLHKYSPADCTLGQDPDCIINWLNKQADNSVLYVSFGSIAVISEDQFQEIAWGLAESRQPFLWVVRPKLVNCSESWFPDEFVEAVADGSHIVKWAPQQLVLAHPAIGGFWTHCGWNSTIESISEGVPMICLPFFGEQQINARLITHVWGVGLQLEGKLEREEIEMGIRRLMVEEEGKEMRERVKMLKDKAEICLREGGSSYECLDQLTRRILSFLN